MTVLQFPKKAPPKHPVRVQLEQRLEDGLVLVLVLSDFDGVSLPDTVQPFPVQFIDDKGQHAHLNGVYLRFSLRFKHPLIFEEAGVRTTLSFNDAEHEVFIPWAAIAGMKNT